MRAALIAPCIVLSALLRMNLSAQQHTAVEGGKSAALAARQAVSSAQKLQAAGDFNGALRVLSDAIELCPMDPKNTRECRGRVNYGTGYVTQLQAASTDAPAEALTTDALRAYRAVLTDYPSHPDALRNIWLLYSKLGGASLNAAELRAAADKDPARKSGYLTLLGDYYASKGDIAAARAAYRDAVQAAPTDPDPRRQLLGSYDVTKAAEADTMLVQLATLEATFPEVAADGYMQLLDERAEGDQGVALTRWVALQAARGQSPRAFVGELNPRVLGTKAGADLSAYIKDPWLQPAPNNWWLRNDASKMALARVGLRIGEQMLATEKPGRIEKCWFIALGLTRQNESAALDLQRSLALLYDGHRELDPDGQKFGAVEERMFSSKGDAIASHDLLTEQRYHSTLAIIYAQRGQWRTDSYAHNAIYQLTATLRTAAERDRENGTYQPLPLIRELLAEAYAFDKNANDQRMTLLAASRAYLDLDDVARASTLLDSTHVEGSDADVLRRLIQARTPARGKTLAPCTPATTAALNALGNDAGFAARQRFKVLADCVLAKSATQVINSYLALAIALSPNFTLTGASDLMRLDAVRGLVLGRTGVRARDLELYRGAPPKVPDSRGQAIAVSLDDEPAFILLSASEARIAPRTAR